MHPIWRQEKLVDFCKIKGIHVTAYSPFGAIKTSKRNNQTVASNLVEEIAKAHDKTSAQVSFPPRKKIIACHLKLERTIIPSITFNFLGENHAYMH